MPTLGVIVNNPDAVFQSAVIPGIKQVAAQNGYTVRVETYQDAAHDEAGLRDMAGVVVIADAAPDDFVRDVVKKMGKPVSLVCHQIHDSSIPVVMSNNAQGIAELVKHLVKRCGRRDLVFIRGLMSQNDGREREIAFRQELIRYNMNIPEEYYRRGDFDPTVAAASIRELLDNGQRFDGILASDYVMAIAAVEVLHTAGIAVPEDVSVVGFGDGLEAENAGLTTVAASIVELGTRAARQLINQINGRRISGVTTLSVRLVVRQTCGYKLIDGAIIENEGLA